MEQLGATTFAEILMDWKKLSGAMLETQITQQEKNAHQ